MSFASTFTFWSISLLLAYTPGADWAYVLSSTIKHKSPRPSVAGLVLGYLGLVVIGAVGLFSGVVMVIIGLLLLGEQTWR